MCMNKSKFILLVGVLLIAVAAALLWFSRDKADPDHLVLYGNVDIRQVSLAFETAGRIQSLAVQEGDRVQKGQVLAELNTDSLTIQAQQAQAQLQVQQQTLNEQAAGNRPEEITQAKAKVQSAQAQFENADKQSQRLNVLNRSTAGQAVSKQEIDAAKSNMKMAEAAVGETKANLELLLKGARTEDREAAKAQYSQTTLLFIQDSKKTRNNSSTESINHSLRLRLTHAHICSIGFKSGLYAGSQRILCPCCSNNS